MKGLDIILGGGRHRGYWKKQLYTKLANFAGDEHANIGVITAASGPKIAEENGNYHIDLFQKYGCKNVQWIPITSDDREKNEDEDLVKKIESMTGFFLGGGDQSRLIDCLQDSSAFDAIKRAVYQNGAVIGGRSAGCVGLSQLPMITSNRTHNPDGGLGFFSYGLLDSHFSQVKREKRIVALARKTDTKTAYGIDENTFLIVNDANTDQVSMEIFGEHQVHVFTVENGTYEVQSLRSGSVYNPLTGEIL